MKKTIVFLLSALGSVVISQATSVEVTTANSTGPGSLLAALAQLHDGDTVTFNIPGTGPHYIQTPVGGYPIITNNNITIDGYTEPGASPNTNPIHASNNAKIEICLDSRNGNATDMGNIALLGPSDEQYGFGHGEWAVVGFFRGTNAWVKGIAILSSPQSADKSADIKSISFARDYIGSCANWHVSGCWIGVDPADGQIKYLSDGTIAAPAIAIAAYRHRDASGGNPVYPEPGTIGVAAGSADPRAEFNVIVNGYGFDSEGLDYRISGNFFGVLPDGMTDADFSVLNGGQQMGDGFVEVGRDDSNVIIGTDGDGTNDADEGNVFGGIANGSASGAHMINFYSSPQTNIVIAGNWFGVAVDGVTRFTNSCTIVDSFTSQATVQFGSDFDGVSDDLEGNVIANNYPFATLFPDPPGSPLPKFASIDPGARVSLRGNVLINNNIPPFSYADGLGGQLNNFTNYSAPYIDTTLTNGIIPQLSTNSTQEHLIGSCGLGVPPYTNITIDVYLADPEGWTNGQAFVYYELMDPITFAFNGFPQGRTFIASFQDNGPLDRDPRPGFFDLNLSSYNLGSAFVTVAANYSADPPGTHNGRVQTSEFAVPVTAAYVPGGIESVGLKRITPDTPIIVPPADALGNWEPYTSVLGDNMFLIEGNTFATNDLANQRFIVYFQPADGSTGRLGDSFFADDGTPFRDQINLSRQNGNPGRVAGDKRPGATMFLTAAETSAGQLAPFQSDSRYTNQPVNPAFSWTNNPIYGGGNSSARYATEQAFSLNPTNLTQTPLTPAFDAVYGDFVTNELPSDTTQVSRTGGSIVALDNGNFAVVIDDRSDYLSSSESATAAIITPAGTVVKGPWLVDPRDIWDNVAAYKGGFAVRVHNMMYFYDDNGNLMGSVDVVASSGVSFSTDRGDGTRIAAHINSPYVYLCGSPGNQEIWLAVFDSRTQSFVTATNVSEPSFVASTGRAAVASDALDRITCAWESQPAGYGATQVAARVMKFDAASKTISPLTRSFWVFVNTSATGNILSHTMNVSMTTKQICVAAKGDINLQDNPTKGANSPQDIDFFTVFTHPAPAADPTTPVGVVPSSGPKLTITLNGNQATISWPTDAVGFTLESTGSLTSPNWAPVSGVTANNSVTVTVGAANQFYRLRK